MKAGPERGVSFPLGDPTRNAVILQSQSCEDEDEVVWVPKKRKAGRSNRATFKRRKTDGPPLLPLPEADPTICVPKKRNAGRSHSTPKERKRPRLLPNTLPKSKGELANTMKRKRQISSDTVNPPKGRKRARPLINALPTTKLEVYVFGTGDFGELGLGPANTGRNVKRPRKNPFLTGVVGVALGGMHGLALTDAGEGYSWGVNDTFALGRSTIWKVDEDDEDEPPMNPYESTPHLVKFPKGTMITRIAAGDNISVALTETGSVYAWGTFRVFLTVPITPCMLLTLSSESRGKFGL